MTPKYGNLGKSQVSNHFILLHRLLQFFILEISIPFHLPFICSSNPFFNCHVTASFTLKNRSKNHKIEYCISHLALLKPKMSRDVFARLESRK